MKNNSKLVKINTSLFNTRLVSTLIPKWLSFNIKLNEHNFFYRIVSSPTFSRKDKYSIVASSLFRTQLDPERFKWKTRRYRFITISWGKWSVRRRKCPGFGFRHRATDTGGTWSSITSATADKRNRERFQAINYRGNIRCKSGAPTTAGERAEWIEDDSIGFITGNYWPRGKNGRSRHLSKMRTRRKIARLNKHRELRGNFQSYYFIVMCKSTYLWHNVNVFNLFGN